MMRPEVPEVYVHVPKHGDCVFVYLDRTSFSCVYIDPVLTVFENLDDHHLVGFQLKGLSVLRGMLKDDDIEALQSWPIIQLLFEGFKLDAPGVESKWRLHNYVRVTKVVAMRDTGLFDIGIAHLRER